MRALIEEMVEDIFATIVEIRKDLHRHPELGLEEYRTADVIEHYLMSWNISVGPRINKTSLVSVIHGEKGGGTVVGLRADIDALPIQELNNHDYKSVYDGKMHACGHDVHTAIQLGAAYVLKQLAPFLPGSVKLLFQQAEETVGGAKTMIEAGVLENPTVDVLLGLHVDPDYPVGTLGIKYGVGYGSSDDLDILIKGKAAHAAKPNKGIDAIVVASHLVVALQTLISRSTSPLESAVLSFGQINGGTAHNVMAHEVRLIGTLRTLNPTVREVLKDKIKTMAHQLCASFGADAEVLIEPGYDPVVNDDGVTKKVEKVAQSLFGHDKVLPLLNPSLGVEDFGYFATARPASFNRLGVANAALNIIAPVHEGHFDIDHEALKHGIMLQVCSVLEVMGVAWDD